jgi:nucleotide-binding universal stress UspA family protein
MTGSVRHQVVAGVDGSTDSLAAADEAAAEAAYRRLPLLLVCAYRSPPVRYQPTATHWRPRVEAERALVDALARVRDTHPQLPVTTEYGGDDLAETLLARSAGADLVVLSGVGCRGETGLLARSAATRVAARARCPVLVVRRGADAGPEPRGRRPVLVGVGASASASAAIGLAYEEAALRRVPLRAVHVWSAGGIDPEAGGDLGRYEEEARRLLADAVGTWSDKYPQVDVSCAPVYGPSARQVLIEESSGAGLVTVGCHGRNALAGALLGPVSRGLVHHAGCPVLVAPAA